MIFVAPQNDNDINGIIHQYGEKLFLYVDSSSNYSDDTSAQNLIAKEPHNDFYAPDNSPNVSIYFPKTPLRLNSYTVQSPKKITEVHFPRCWELYGQHENEWSVISTVTESGLNGKGLIKVFPIYGEAAFIPYTAATLKATCNNYNPNGDFMYLIIYSIDFYGIITMPHSICFKQLSFPRSMFYLFLILYLS